MSTKTVVVLLISLALWSIPYAEAQQLSKIARIGYLAAACPDTQSARTAAFRQGLRDLGYIEGQNIAIEYR